MKVVLLSSLFGLRSWYKWSKFFLNILPQVREIVLSFLSRSSVAIAIGTSVADMRLKQNISDDVPKSKKKKQRKGNEDGTSSSSSVTASDSNKAGPALRDVILKPSILNITDGDDYAGDSVFI